ncbi:YkoP family protein [Brevibacillus sp. 179-C9.3 HS]|uniref:YkoP family protein n=1 Tax=unclassified Brevibacillus TaxID=2684853 RepID=UPI00399FD138
MNTSLLMLWGCWDEIYQRCTRLTYIDKGNNIFRVVVLRYRGEPLVTTDNCTIHDGDMILKLHIHNYYFATLCKGVKDELRVALLLRRHILQSLPKLAAFLETMENKEQIKGIVGTTMLHKGVSPLGFSISDVPMNWFFHYKRWYLRIMLRIVHPDGKRRVQTWNHEMPLKRVYMSKELLLNRYGQREQPLGEPH